MGCNCKKKKTGENQVNKRSMFKELRDNIESGVKTVKKISNFIYETVIIEKPDDDNQDSGK